MLHYSIPLALILGSIVLVFSVIRWIKIDRLKALVSRYEDATAQPMEVGAPPILSVPSIQNTSLGKSLSLYVNSFNEAATSGNLKSFSVEHSMAPLRRAVSNGSGFLRPFAGWMLLLGLIVTLLNLQGSVNHLGTAFQNFGGARVHDSSATDNGTIRSQDVGRGSPSTLSSPADDHTEDLDKSSEDVRKGMSEIAHSASSAFHFSLVFISLALFSMFLATILEYRAKTLLRIAESWAFKTYFANLNIRSNDADRAGRDLAVAAKNLEAVVGTFSRVVEDFALLGPMVAAMTTTSRTIESAMQRLPEDLKSSMTNVSAELVQGLNRSLEGTNEGVAKILEIYGTQQLRMDDIRRSSAEIATANKSIAASAEKLEPLSSAVSKLDKTVNKSTKTIDDVAKLLGRTSDLIAEWPSDELKSAVGAQTETNTKMSELAATMATTMNSLQLTVEEHKSIHPQMRAAVDGSNQRIQHLARMLDSFQQTNSTAMKSAYLAPLADDVLQQLMELRATSEASEFRRKVDALTRQVRSVREHALSQANNFRGSN